MNIAYYNGKKCQSLHQVSIYNPSFLYGINVFEGIRAYWNQDLKQMNFFDLDQHLDRLYQSADCISFSYPIEKKALREELVKIINEEEIQENIYLRITFFVDGDTNWQEQSNISYIISIRSMSSKILSQTSQALCISYVRRISSKAMPPSIKAGANYLNSRYALLEARKRGFDGALFLNDQQLISESTGSCVFFIQGDSLITPSVDCDILVGITRNRIIAIAQQHGIRVVEATVSPDSLSQYEACFLAGTMIEIMPISKIDEVNFNTLHNKIFNFIINQLNQYVHGEKV